MAPTITVTLPNPEWPAFRDGMDAAIKKAEEDRDIVAWKLACRRRMAHGFPEDVPDYLVVGREFHELLLEHQRQQVDFLGEDFNSLGDQITFQGTPVNVKE